MLHDDLMITTEDGQRITLAEWIAGIEKAVAELCATVAALTIEVNRLTDLAEYQRLHEDAK